MPALLISRSIEKASILPWERRASAAAVRLLFREVDANGLRIHLPEQLILIKLIWKALPGSLQEYDIMAAYLLTRNVLWRDFICTEICGGDAKKSSKWFYNSAPKVEQYGTTFSL
jgi:hypothetical protein